MIMSRQGPFRSKSRHFKDQTNLHDPKNAAAVRLQSANVVPTVVITRKGLMMKILCMQLSEVTLDSTRISMVQHISAAQASSEAPYSIWEKSMAVVVLSFPKHAESSRLSSTCVTFSCHTGFSSKSPRPVPSRRGLPFLSHENNKQDD